MMDADQTNPAPTSIPSPPGPTEADIATWLNQPMPEARRKRWWRRFGGPLLILLSALLSVGVYLVARVNRHLDESLAAAGRDDPNWRLEDLMAHRVPVPDAENSALIVAKTLALLPEGWPGGPVQVPGAAVPAPTSVVDASVRASYTEGNVRLDDATAETLRSELKAHHEAVRLARTLVTYDRGRHELKLGPRIIDTLLPETNAARTVARLLAADAAVLAQDGRIDDALESCRAILSVGRSIGDEPFLISQLVRVAIGTMAMDTTRRVLGQGEPSDDALARLQALILDELTQPLNVYGMRGYRAVLNAVFRRLETGEMPSSALSDAEYKSDPNAPRTAVAPWDKFLYKNQRAIAIEWLNEYIAIARRPAHERPPLWKALEAKVDRLKRSRLGAYTAALPLTMTAGLSASDSAFSRYQGELGTTAILLAAERHRRKHGGWPASISAIDPALLSKTPLDPYSGKPFLMERRDEQLLVHSVGRNLEDDGGEFDRVLSVSGGPDDVGTGAWDMARRRQTPLPEIPGIE